MRSTDRVRTWVVPKHRDRPHQWVHTPWLLLGMLFILGLMLASRVVSPVNPGNDVRHPTEQVNDQQGP